MDKEDAKNENEIIDKEILKESQLKHETRNHITKLFNPILHQETIISNNDKIPNNNFKPFSIRGFYDSQGSIDISNINKNSFVKKN